VADKIRREYVLPNGSTVIEGFVRTANTPPVPGEQVLTLLNERFCVPEVLFTPSDVGLNQMGVSESIAAAIAACPGWMQPLLADNVLLVGGNVSMANFAARVERDLRPLLPSEMRISVRAGASPSLTTWQGGSMLASSPTEREALQYATKADLAEWGSQGLTRRWEGDEDEDNASAAGEGKDDDMQE
jgi:actin-related protein 6